MGTRSARHVIRPEKKTSTPCHGRGLPGPYRYRGADIGRKNNGMNSQIQNRLEFHPAVERQHSGTLNKPATQRRILSVREAALYLGRSEKSVRHLVQKRKIRSIRADGRVMFDLFDLDAWIEMHRV
jgi:excisionase family DNA binding protein